ncbi:MAG: ATP-dependent Clp protease ATP-binding subunit [Patescibacteria group bacterium]|nr:ATP-dependent Clp protease ATP-binding subunit [Patescibacteria group bacterium]
MIENAKVYYYYRTFTFRLLRILTFTSLLWTSYIGFSNNLLGVTVWRLPLFFLSFFIISEIFFRFKIAKYKPLIPVLENDGKNILKSFTLEALDALFSSSKTSSVVRVLLSKRQVKFILQKSGIEKNEFQLIEIQKEELTKSAFELVKSFNGKLVTTMDLFVAYLLTTEPSSKLLFNKNLKKEELVHILFWARYDFSFEENPKPRRVKFWGEGIGEDWVTGWTLETKKYTMDITSQILKKEIVLVGREKEFKQMMEALYRGEKSNVLLVGESGCGKATLVEKFAFESIAGNLQGRFTHLKFYELLIGPLLAGVATQGDLEERLQAIIEEISHSLNIVIFIPDIQNILGASTFNLNLSGALIPYLKDRRIIIIATSEPLEYKRYIEPEKGFIEFFEVIKVIEPDSEKALEMLLEKANIIEINNHVLLTYRAVTEAIRLSKKYSQNLYLPGAAATLLADTASSVYLSGKKIVKDEDVIRKVEEKTNISISAPKEKERELLLNFEQKLHERIIDQEDAVFAIAEAIRRVRSGLANQNRPISFLFLGPTGVGKTETSKALASLYFGGEEKMIRLDMSEYQGEDGEKRLLGAPPGQGYEKGELTEKVYDNPYSLVLLDEFEKANPKVLDLFLQVLEDGRLTDNKGKTVSFENSIIIATSNAGSEFIREQIENNIQINKEFQAKLLELLQTRGIFKPELLNRFDAVVVFKPLGEKEVIEITKLILNSVSKELLKQDITVNFDETIVQKIAKEGFDIQFGARPLRRFIQDNVEDLIAKKILNGEINRGSNILVSTDQNNSITISLLGG